MVETSKDHVFKPKGYGTVQLCYLCHHYIWAFQKGVICKECKLPCHSACISNITEPCSKTPKAWKVKIPQKQHRNEKHPTTHAHAPSLWKLRKEKFTEKYLRKSILFRNSNLQVHKVKSKETNETVIAKAIPLSPRSDPLLNKHIQSLKEIQHPNLVSFREAFVEKKNLIITSDQADGRAFFQPLCDRDYVTESDVSGLIKSVLEALEHLHDNKIIHGMLRPEFIFVKDDDLSVKLSDFGLWRIVGPDILRDAPCCKMYLAPELLQNLGFGAGIDMWCVGVITYYLLSGTPPFYGSNAQIISEAVSKADFDYPEDNGWDNISDNAIDFIDCLLVTNPRSRMNVRNALQHPFIQNPSPCTVLLDIPEQLNSIMRLYQHDIQLFTN